MTDITNSSDVPSDDGGPTDGAAADAAVAPEAAGTEPTVSHPTAAAEKDPDEWVTGDEPMTGAQASYLGTLAQDTGRSVPEHLTKADASKLIDELQAASGRASS